MGKRDGSWQLDMTVDGKRLQLNTDDLTLDELDVAEQISGIAWAAINPLRSVRAAKGLLAVLLIRAGTAEDVAEKEVGALTMGAVSDVFAYVPPTSQPLPEPAEGSVPPF